MASTVLFSAALLAAAAATGAAQGQVTGVTSYVETSSLAADGSQLLFGGASKGAKKEKAVNVDGYVDYDSIVDESGKAHSSAFKKPKRRGGSSSFSSPSPLVGRSPTGSDNLLLDFLRFSSFEHAIRSDGVTVSNTTGPSIVVTAATAPASSVEEKEGTRKKHKAAVARVEVPHLVQVWAVRQAQSFSAANGDGPSWHLSPDALTTHYFAVEHAATAVDRAAVTGEADVAVDGGMDGAVPHAAPAKASARPFAVRGTAYAAPPASVVSSDNPVWVNAVGALRNSPVGAFAGDASLRIQEALLEGEAAVRRLWRRFASGETDLIYPSVLGKASSPSVFAASEVEAVAPSLNITDARLVALTPTTPLAGSFAVELAFAGISGAIVLNGNYSFAPSRGFLPNLKISGPAAHNAHTYFDYSLTFVASGPIEQRSVHSNGRKDSSSSSPPPRCTHFRAIAQHDKRNLVLTTYWTTADAAAAAAADGNGKTKPPPQQESAVTFERSVTLNLQEVAGTDVRYDAAGGDDDVEEEERQRFRFMDVVLSPAAATVGESAEAGNAPNDGTADVLSDVRTFRSVAALSMSEGKIVHLQPALRRVEVPFYYADEAGDTHFARSQREASGFGAAVTRLIPFGSRLRRLLPTIALLLIVTLVKFGPKFYLTWLDAKQRRRKGQVSMRDAVEASLKPDLLRRAGAEGAAPSAAALAARERARAAAEEKAYGSGKQLAKAEAILKGHMATNPQWRKSYEETMARRKQMTPEELDDLKAQERAIVEEMKREDGLL